MSNTLSFEAGDTLTSPHGRGVIHITEVNERRVVAYVDGSVWNWPRRTTERVLQALGFCVVNADRRAQ